MTVHLSLKSGNAKTGPIPVSTTSAESCPLSCGQYVNCYGKYGPLALHWAAVTGGERGMQWDAFTAAIAALPQGQLWRHNQAGDLPGADSRINPRMMRGLVRANSGRRGFTFTHKPVTGNGAARSNRRIIAESNKGGFTINLSADTVVQADKYKALNIAPVVITVPENTEAFTTPAGHKVVICPAQTHENVSCDTCRLCAWAGRDVIIGFRAHGTKKRSITAESVFNIIK